MQFTSFVIVISATDDLRDCFRYRFGRCETCLEAYLRRGHQCTRQISRVWLLNPSRFDDWFARRLPCGTVSAKTVSFRSETTVLRKLRKQSRKNVFSRNCLRNKTSWKVKREQSVSCIDDSDVNKPLNTSHVYKNRFQVFLPNRLCRCNILPLPIRKIMSLCVHFDV